jgi:hypothetical protein
MACQHLSTGNWSTDLTKRQFLKSALAIGGSSALSACVECYGKREVPQGQEDVTGLPDRQHAWNEYLPRDQHGNTVLLYHQLLLFFRYRKPRPPTAAEREEVERAFRSLERAFEWGNGGENPYRKQGKVVEGLLCMVGYSPRYFGRFEETLPGSVDLQPTEEVVSELEESRDTVDRFDGVVLLVGHYVQVLLAAEQALYCRPELLILWRNRCWCDQGRGQDFRPDERSSPRVTRERDRSEGDQTSHRRTRVSGRTLAC